MGTNPSSFKGSTHPVENVSWCDAVLFCNRLSALEGLEPCYELPEPFKNDNCWSQKVVWNRSANGYRLPTEAEWEYCARGGESHLYSGSDNIDEVAWYRKNSDTGNGTETHGVGQKKANGFELYDMSGNVFEWVWNTWRDYEKGDVTESSIDDSSPIRVFRGGGLDRNACLSRVSYRRGYGASYYNYDQGFRILRTIPITALP